MIFFLASSELDAFNVVHGCHAKHNLTVAGVKLKALFT